MANLEYYILQKHVSKLRAKKEDSFTHAKVEIIYHQQIHNTKNDKGTASSEVK